MINDLSVGSGAHWVEHLVESLGGGGGLIKSKGDPKVARAGNALGGGRI